MYFACVLFISTLTKSQSIIEMLLTCACLCVCCRYINFKDFFSSPAAFPNTLSFIFSLCTLLPASSQSAAAWNTSRLFIGPLQQPSALCWWRFHRSLIALASHWLSSSRNQWRCFSGEKSNTCCLPRPHRENTSMIRFFSIRGKVNKENGARNALSLVWGQTHSAQSSRSLFGLGEMYCNCSTPYWIVWLLHLFNDELKENSLKLLNIPLQFIKWKF